MLRSTASKVMWVGRATVFLVGLAVILALVLGVTSMAFGANGDFFKVGERNVASATSTLVRNGVGPVLSLQAMDGPPLKTNSRYKVANLNADKLDGKDATDFAGSGKSSYEQLSTILTPCDDQVLLSRTFSPARPALVYASGAAVYERNRSNLMVGMLRLELRNTADDSVVASGAYMDATANGDEVPLSVQGVLMSGGNVWNSSTPFEVTPGNTYDLRLVGRATNGGCDGFPTMGDIALSYLLIGK